MAASLTRVASLKKKVAASVFCASLLAFAPRGGYPEETPELLVRRTLRTVMAAEATYSALNGGFFDHPTCLANPTCIPGIDRDVPGVWSPGLATAMERRGYRLEFHAGPMASKPGRVSPSSMTRFAFVAMPMSTEKGVKGAYCVDDRGTTYLTPDGTRPRVEAGRCVDKSQPLR